MRVLTYPEFPAWQILVRRLVEIELHHTDLNAGYEPAEWPASFTTMDLDAPCTHSATTGSQPRRTEPASLADPQVTTVEARPSDSIRTGRHDRCDRMVSSTALLWIASR